VFDVRFSIDRIAGTLKLILTDTSDYTGVSSVVGFYKVIYPDGIFRENTDALNPDFTIVDSETEITLRTSNGRLMFGTYTIIQQSNRNTGYVQEQSVFTFDFAEFTPAIENQSNTLTPIIQFDDASVTLVDNHTFVSHTYTLESDWPASTGVAGSETSTGAPLEMVDAGDYYEGIYEVLIQVETEYTTPDYTLVYKNQTTTTFDIRRFPSWTEIGALINLVKERLDASASKARYERLYWQISSLYVNILSNIRSGEPINDLVLEMQQVAYETSLCCNSDDYEYSDQPLTASPLSDYDGFLAVANSDGVVQFTSETNNVLRFQGTGSNSVTFNPATGTIIIGSISETLYVRYDTAAQGLNATQRQNARTNIQALARDVADTHTGTLAQNGALTVNGQMTINQAIALIINTLEDGSASSNVVSISNTNGGGLFLQRRGSLRVRARGDSLTSYYILELENNASVRTRVFGVIGTDGYTEIGRSAVPLTTVLLKVFGKVEHADAVNPAESATLGQVNSLIAIALEDVIAGESYRGTWNASTNTPTLVSSVGTTGHYYQVSVAGSTTLDGISSWVEGDEVVFNGTVWIKRASFGIKTLNGKTGSVVTLNQDEVPDGATYKQYSDTEKTKLAGIEAGADVTDGVNVGASIHGATSKTTPVDADTVALIDSADSNLLKKLSWLNIKATLKTYFDTLYQVVLISGTNIKTVGGTSVLGSGNIALPTGVTWTTVPANKTATGTVGQFARDADFIYYCYATNLWERTPIDTSTWSTV
jgi:hypothetical protein